MQLIPGHRDQHIVTTDYSAHKVHNVILFHVQAYFETNFRYVQLLFKVYGSDYSLDCPVMFLCRNLFTERTYVIGKNQQSSEIVGIISLSAISGTLQPQHQSGRETNHFISLMYKHEKDYVNKNTLKLVQIKKYLHKYPNIHMN